MAYFILLLIRSIAALDASKVIYAVNCGGPSLRASDGVEYVADERYSSGISSDFGTSTKFLLTKDPEIYQTERYDLSSFFYKLPITDEGSYVLILKFSEVYFTRENEKVFDVKLGDLTVVKDLDIYSKVGKASAYDVFVPFTLKDSQVYVEEELAKGAWRDGEMNVSFIKGHNDNPKVNAILILKGTLKDTPHDEQKKSIEQLRKMKETYEDKKSYNERVVEHDEPIEEDPNLDFEEFEWDEPIQESDNLVSVLMTTPGLVFLAVIACLSVSALLIFRPKSNELKRKQKNTETEDHSPKRVEKNLSKKKKN